MTEYALYVWSGWLSETELDRVPEWFEPAVLRGEKMLVHDDITLYEAPLRIDVSRSLFSDEDEEKFILGRDIAPSATGDWQACYLRLATDGSADDAERVLAEIFRRLEDDGTLEFDWDRDDAPTSGPPIGECVSTWDDPHGIWSAALVKL